MHVLIQYPTTGAVNGLRMNHLTARQLDAVGIERRPAGSASLLSSKESSVTRTSAALLFVFGVKSNRMLLPSCLLGQILEAQISRHPQGQERTDGDFSSAMAPGRTF